MRPHRGVLILVLGILGLVGCGIITAIPAWVMGSGDLKEMDAGLIDPAGRSMTQAGKICGIISTILFCLALVGVLIFFLFVAGGAALQQR